MWLDVCGMRLGVLRDQSPARRQAGAASALRSGDLQVATCVRCFDGYDSVTLSLSKGLVLLDVAWLLATSRTRLDSCGITRSS